MYQSELVLFTLFAYLVGSISSAIIVCKLMGLPDPRTQGSQNPGATNVLRIGGKKAAALTLFGDVLKGLMPVLLAKGIGLPPLGLALVTFAAFFGHLFPVFFGFHGGKGVATLIGCLLALNWPSGLCWMLIWFIMALLFRYSSLSALTASVLAPCYIWYFTNQPIFAITVLLMSIMLIYRHRSNIAKLLAGKESKIGKKTSINQVL